MPLADSAEKTPSLHGVEKRAIWIVPGSKTKRFAALNKLTEGIIEVAKPGLRSRPRVRMEKREGSVVERVELDIVENGRPIELHLYECYWGAITDGQVNLKDFIGFFLHSAFYGLPKSLKSFRRVMYGGVASFSMSTRMAAVLLLVAEISGFTWLALTVLTTINFAAQVLKAVVQGRSPIAISLPVDLAAIASVLSSVVLVLVSFLFVAHLSKPPSLSLWVKWLISLTAWFACGLTILGVIYGTFFLGIDALLSWNPLPAHVAGQMQIVATDTALTNVVLLTVVITARGYARWVGSELRHPILFALLFVGFFLLFIAAYFGPILAILGFRAVPLHALHFGQDPRWVVPMLLITTYLSRDFLVPYLGDIAVYCMSHKAKFVKLKTKIQSVAFQSAASIYSAGTLDSFRYSQVAVVGHGLGSVIAYDTLNALLLDDNRIGERTSVLVTIGCPLDKIAMFSEIQSNPRIFDVRRSLETETHPLIKSYRYRRFPWLNIYSRNDLISDKLYLYDMPGMDDHPASVTNIRDFEAIVPLVAHAEYWSNPEVWKRLYSMATNS